MSVVVPVPFLSFFLHYTDAALLALFRPHKLTFCESVVSANPTGDVGLLPSSVISPLGTHTQFTPMAHSEVMSAT